MTRAVRSVAIAALVSMATVCGAAAAPAPLRLCADPANLPFSSARPGVPGLYMEIGALIGQALQRPVDPVWTQTYFGKRTIRTTLLAGACDLAVGLPDDADFMGPRLIFSRPILRVGYALVAPPTRRIASLEDLRGLRVAVQFGSTPQGLLAQRDDVTMVTVMDPEAGVNVLAAGDADVAFVWGPSAGYANQTAHGGAFRVVPVAGAGLDWPAAIGFARKHADLRDDVDRAIDANGPEIAALVAKYGFPTAQPVKLTDADTTPTVIRAAAAATPDTPEMAAQGKELFNETCAHCHGPDAVQAERRINLRLLHHRYGDQMDEVFLTTVTHGRPDKGMPNWSGIIADEDFLKIRAFLHTVQSP